MGYVLSVGDGIAHVSGLNGCRNNELLRFDGDKFGIAFNLERDNVGVILLDKTDDIEEGSKVEGTAASSPCQWARACSAAWSTPWAAPSTA